MNGKIEGDPFVMGKVAAQARLERSDNPFDATVNTQYHNDWLSGFLSVKSVQDKVTTL
jgi:hypothetical protein